MKLYVSGQKAFGAAVYELCKALGHEIVGVSAPISASDDKRYDRLRAAAMRDNVPVLNAGLLKERTLPDGLDLIVAAHSHDYISRQTRNKTKLGAIGYHPSLLPIHRGRDAVRWAIKMGDKITGGSVFWLNDKVDAGDIASQKHAFISADDTPESLWRDKLFPLGLELITKTLNDLSNGLIIAIPQDESVATWEPSIGRAPLFRPDLPMLGAPPAGFTIVKHDRALADYIKEQMQEAV